MVTRDPAETPGKNPKTLDTNQPPQETDQPPQPVMVRLHNPKAGVQILTEEKKAGATELEALYNELESLENASKQAAA